MSQRPRKKTFRKRHPPAGAKPGTLMINAQAGPPLIRVFEYTASQVKEHHVRSADQVRGLLREDAKFWIDVQGVGDERLLKGLAEIFHIHPLALEDVVNVPSRPKAEPHEHHLLIITRMATPAGKGRIATEQVSIFVGANYVLTFQQDLPGDVFDPVRERLRNAGGAMRAAGPDYLAYAIWDAIIDGYFPVFEEFGEHLEDLEIRAVQAPATQLLAEIHDVKRYLLDIRRSLWPQREAINSILRDCPKFMTETVRLHLRDCYDHCVQLLDVVETYRELASGLMDIYLSSLSNRQNEIMKVLTIMASIFIPLTFLVGVYGMNFDYMPELHERWAYPVLWVLMLLICLGMVVYFRRKGWISRAAPLPSRWRDSDSPRRDEGRRGEDGNTE
jgi:magnesium transporter